MIFCYRNKFLNFFDLVIYLLYRLNIRSKYIYNFLTKIINTIIVPLRYIFNKMGLAL